MSMASFLNYFAPRRDVKKAERDRQDAIVTMRQHLQLIEKKEGYLLKRINDEFQKAKQKAVSNKAGEAAAFDATYIRHS